MSKTSKIVILIIISIVALTFAFGSDYIFRNTEGLEEFSTKRNNNSGKFFFGPLAAVIIYLSYQRLFRSEK